MRTAARGVVRGSGNYRVVICYTGSRGKEPTMDGRITRGYNVSFRAVGKGKTFFIEGIPTVFWERVKRMAKRDGHSLRGLILTLLKHWLEEREAENAAAVGRIRPAEPVADGAGGGNPSEVLAQDDLPEGERGEVESVPSGIA